MTDISLKGKASRLKVLVSETGATRQAFADLTGKTAQAAQDWINSGKIKDENLQLIADRYGYSITWLLTGDGDIYLTDTIGHRIHAARMGKGMTQAVLADKSRCAEGYIFRWETDSETPSKKQLIYLSGVLDVDTEWISWGGSHGKKKAANEIVTCGTEQWELDAITALRGMDDDRRRRALQDLADGAELERLKKTGTDK